MAAEVNPYEGYFYAIMARLDQLEARLENLVNKVITEVNNGNKPKDLPANERARDLFDVLAQILLDLCLPVAYDKGFGFSESIFLPKWQAFFYDRG